jgi:hypothetical protein
MSRLMPGLVVVVVLVAVTIAAPARAEGWMRGGVDVAAPVDLRFEDGAAVVMEASAGAAVDALLFRLRAPLVARVDQPRLDLGNLLVRGTWRTEEAFNASLSAVVPTLWPATSGQATQAASLGLAATGLGLEDVARFLPATTGVGVDVAFEFFDDPFTMVRGGVGALVSLAGAPVQVPVFASVRVASTDELAFYLGTSIGALTTPTDFLAQSSLTVLGEIGVTARLDAWAFDLGLGAGVVSTPEVSFGGVVTPRLIVAFGA